MPAPMVQLKGVAQRPIVMGREVDPISAPKYQVIEALLAAGPNGMSKSELEAIKGDAIRYLRAFAHANLAGRHSNGRQSRASLCHRVEVDFSANPTLSPFLHHSILLGVDHNFGCVFKRNPSGSKP